MALGASLLWKMAKLVVASGVAETAAERLIERVKTVVGTPRAEPLPGVREPRPGGAGHAEAQLARQQARIETLEGLVREQDAKLASIAVTLERFGEDLRPLVLRATLTFWTALGALVLAAVALVVALRA